MLAVLDYALFDSRPRDREQLPHGTVERLKFLRRTAHVASSVTLIVCLGACALAQSQPPPQTPTEVRREQQQNRADDQRDTGANDQVAKPAAPTVEESIANPTAGAKTQQNGANGDQESSSPRDRLPDYAVAFFTLVLTIVSIRQFRIMRRQADYMRDGLAETKKAADAATMSANAATQALIMTNRAVLDTGRWRADGSVSIANLGAAPARLEQIIVMAGAAGSEIRNYAQPYDLIVAPGETVWIDRVLNEPPGPGTQVVGRIDYRDRRSGRRWVVFGGLFREIYGWQEDVALGLTFSAGPVTEGVWGVDRPPPPPVDRDYR